MKYEINSFTGRCPVSVETSDPSTRAPLVHVIQFTGSLRFQHNMTPTQAREMAAALIACADAQEAPINADFAAHREMIGVMA